MKRSASPIAQVLLAYKKEHGLTIKQMAEPLGIDKLVIWQLLNGEPIKSLSTAQRLAKAFRLSTAELGEMLTYLPEKKEKKRRDAA